MDKYDVIEFSKIYKRLLEVEITLKKRLILTLELTYPNTPFNRILPYLQNDLSHSKYISRKKKNKRDRINDLINSNKTQHDKLLKFFKIAYLRDVLNLLTDYRKLTKDKAFKRNFYVNIIPLNIIEQNAANLNELRNVIMHFDFNRYSQKKKEFLISLGFWERLLLCPNSFLHTLPPIKPDTRKILKLLESVCPDFYNLDDRIICDMFDDLAFINGKDIKDLPSFWTIGREIYRLKQVNKKL